MIAPRRLRAPQQDGGVLAEPPLTEVGRLLADNRRRLNLEGLAILGRPWSELRSRARESAVAAARQYLQSAGEPVPDGQSHSLLLAGHQPELFHPGVWIKNFALNGLARAHGSTPLNLVVDNDTAKANGLRIPTFARAPLLPGGWGEGPATELVQLVTIPFDFWANDFPYEERRVRDEKVFAQFPARAAEAMHGWPFTPLLPAFWDEALRQARRTALLGERFVAARRVWERRWGCHNLELPVSALCGTEPFAWFACHLLANLPRFHAVHNACLHDYRRQYHLRSRNHPVADLVREGDWLEVPFWAWRAERPRRGRLLARVGSGTVALRIDNEPEQMLPLARPGDAAAVVAAWQGLERQGFKVRSRALTNTIYARLFLADLFIHGIGGGKYDELTDDIIRRFYGFEPPEYLVLSATLLLPLPRFPIQAEKCVRRAWELRDLRCNPQRHLDGDASPEASRLVAEKRAWISRQPADGRQRRERFQVLKSLTARLHPFVTDQEREADEDLARCSRELRANAILSRRDYAFCLYPEEELRQFCTQFL